MPRCSYCCKSILAATPWEEAYRVHARCFEEVKDEIMDRMTDEQREEYEMVTEEGNV